MVTLKPEEYFSPIALLWPFTLSVWMLMCSIAVVGLLFLLISSRLLAAFTTDKNNLNNWSPKTQLLFLVSVFIEHDVPSLKSASSSLRCFLVSWLLFAVVIKSAYRSKLAALWTFPIFPEIPQTLPELVISPDYEIGFMKHGDSAYGAITGSNDPIYLKLVSDMQVFEGRKDFKCLENVFKANNKYKSVCIGYSFSLKYLQQKYFSDKQNRKIIYLSEAKTYIIFL